MIVKDEQRKDNVNQVAVKKEAPVAAINIENFADEGFQSTL